MITIPEIVLLKHHELHDSDGLIECWKVTRHTIGPARSLVAYAERDLAGSWWVATIDPVHMEQSDNRFTAWLHLYHWARARERAPRPAETAPEAPEGLPG